MLPCQGGWKCGNITVCGPEGCEVVAVYGLLQFILSATATVYRSFSNGSVHGVKYRITYP